MPPSISVIIPVFNGGSGFRMCLDALYRNQYADWECIVIDDGSTDGSAAVARNIGAAFAAGAIVIDSDSPRGGPARARNLGAKQARGDVLYFIDADVVVRDDTLAHVAAIFEQQPEIAACFGSYDDQPYAQNFLSQYKNLQHHYVHQTGQQDASTFWTGCGAIRREVFLAMGGFSDQYERPCIEDIELGYRLKAAGQPIRLVPGLQVKHLKRWTPKNLLVTDIRDRAIPWSALIAHSGHLINDLNVNTGQRVSAMMVFLLIGSLIAGVIYPPLWIASVIAVIVLLALNRDFYGFLLRKRGLFFVIRALFWHWLYFVYSTISFVLVTVQERVSPAKG